MNWKELISRKHLLKLAFESMLIVFSVVLALYINDYHSQKKDDEATRNALLKVKTELQTNMELVSNLAPYHQQLKETFEAALLDNEKQQALITSKGVTFWSLMPRGLYQRPLEDAAWKALSNSSVLSNVEFDTMLALSRVYKLQEQGVERSLQHIITLLISREAIQEALISENLTILSFAMSELISQEKFLIQEYQKAISFLEKQAKD